MLPAAGEKWKRAFRKAVIFINKREILRNVDKSPSETQKKELREKEIKGIIAINLQLLGGEAVSTKPINGFAP